jgi:transposase-like protein
MAKGTPIAEDEEQAILKALESGKTTREVAKEFDRGSGTISRIAQRNGLDLGERALTKKADLVRTCYNAEARIRLVGKLLDKAEELMATCDNPRDLQPLATAIAIGIDKRRLEEATDPSARGGEIRILFDKMGEVGE